MDDMHPPRVAISRVYALGGTPPYEDVLQYPLGYTPKGRVPVSTHKSPDRSLGLLIWASWAFVQDCLGLKKRLLNGGEDPSTGKKIYANAFLMMGMFDYNVKRLTKELYTDVDHYVGEAFLDEYKRSGVTQLRIIPIEQALEKDNMVAIYDDVRHLIETRRPINVTECVCRKGKRLQGKKCKVDAPNETCFQFGVAAYMYKNLGLGREISKEEAYDIIDKAEKTGLVIQPGNSQKPGSICCCCSCCCIVITHAKKLPRPLEIFTTNHRSNVDVDACTGCATCVERCPMEALHLDDSNKSVVNEELCIGCGVCVPACPEKAIHLVKKGPEQVPPADQMEMFMKIGVGKGKARQSR